MPTGTDYNPQAGTAWPPGMRTAESWAGIIAAFNDTRVRNHKEPRQYNANFGGVIQAIEDLGAWGNADTSEYPPGWMPIYDDNGAIIGGDWETVPENGEMWFDTRQGRLFTFIDDGFYQTNGADGLTWVSDTPPPDMEVIGAMWFNTSNSALYIFTPTGWEILANIDGSTLNTASLPLANPDPVIPDSNILPPAGSMTWQSDFNAWTYQAFVNINGELQTIIENYSTQLHVSDDAPTVSETQPGDLWFDSSALEMLIYYKPDIGVEGTWVPISVPVNTQAQIDALVADTAELQSDLAEYEAANDATVAALAGSVSSNMTNVTASLNSLAARVTEVENEEVNLSPYVTTSALNAELVDVSAEIAAAIAAIPPTNLSSYVTNSVLAACCSDLQAGIDACVTTTNFNLGVAAITAAIPDVSDKATTTYVDDSIAAIDLSVSTLTDRVPVTKADISLPSLDFSGEKAYGNQAFKFKSELSNNTYATFGTNAEHWEYAWNFTSKEDFCWVHGTEGKIASISEDGLIAKKLAVADFSSNTSDGVVVTNKIDIGETLGKYQTAFEQLRSATNSATDFDSLKAGMLTALQGI